MSCPLCEPSAATDTDQPLAVRSVSALREEIALRCIEWFADGVLAALRGVRRDVCARHELAIREALARRNLKIGRVPPAGTTETPQ